LDLFTTMFKRPDARFRRLHSNAGKLEGKDGGIMPSIRTDRRTHVGTDAAQAKQEMGHRGIAMNPPDPTMQPEMSPATESVAVGPDLSGPTLQATETTPRAGWLVGTALAAGVLAGVLAWAIGERVQGTFVPPSTATNMAGQTIRRISFQDQAVADTKNATLAFAALGGVLGLVLGAAGGIVRKSFSGAVAGVVSGFVLGCGFTAGATWGLLPFYFRALEFSQEAMSHELLLPLLIHCGIWAAAGLAGGVGLAIGAGASWIRLCNSALGGLVGAALGAVVYELVGALVLPGDRTSEPVATTWQGRFLARFLVAVFAAGLAAVVMSAERKPPVPSESKS
jgi:hypothetical protein